MSQRLPLDRINNLARAGLGAGKELARKGLHLAAGGLSRAVGAVQERRQGGGEAAPEPGPRPVRQPGSAPQERPAEDEIPTPADVAKVVEAKPAAKRPRPAAGTKPRSKPAKEAAPGAKLPPLPREPVTEEEPVAKKASRTS
ncbi:hypothetical protein ACFP3Q_03505 [Nocardioides sp. GCM10027113]|uniref:hypothetical protein n=1 Tax=unclassified Nocardioides TaxID=2615069 RepID=UPI00360F8E77